MMQKVMVCQKDSADNAFWGTSVVFLPTIAVFVFLNRIRQIRTTYIGLLWLQKKQIILQAP